MDKRSRPLYLASAARDGVVHRGSPDSYLEQVISYWAPPEAARSLEEFGHGLAFDPAKQELTVKSGDVSLNFLALNLADRVAAGKSSPKEESPPGPATISDWLVQRRSYPHYRQRWR